MIQFLRLFIAVLSLRKPPRILVYAFRIKIDRWFKTGNRRFEFERRYLEHEDAWNYRSSPYEQKKYERTLNTLLAVLNTGSNVLEVGCSIGVFTKMLASRFRAVTAIDISKEAIRTAEEYVDAAGNVRFVYGDLRSLEFGEQYNAIICAEVLSYIPEIDAAKVCQQLERHLVDDGVIILVTMYNKPEQDFFYFDRWDEVFEPYFRILSKSIIDDPIRPYEIVLFGRQTKKSL